MTNKRKCPKCLIDIEYKSKYDMLRADRKKALCRKCCKLGRKRKYLKDYVWERTCPDCDKVIKYKSKFGYNEAIKKNRKCVKCGCGHFRGQTKETNRTLKEKAEKLSQTMKEHRKNNPPWNKGLTKETSDIIAEMAKNHKGFKHTEETKEIIRQASIKHWKDESYREKVIANATIGIRKSYAGGKRKRPINKDTKPELAVEAVLKEMKIKYVKQYPIYSSYPRTRTTVRFYDFYLSKYNKIIEVHGDYWHANPNKYPDESKLTDVQRQTIYNDSDKIKRALDENKRVYVIWEEDTKNEEVLYEKISKILHSTDQLAL